MILRRIGQYPKIIVFAGYFIPVDDFTCLCNGTSRIIWGHLYDKFGYRR